MKRIFSMVLVCALFAACEKYDDSEVKDAIGKLEERVQALEMLNGEIDALKAVVEGKAMVASFVEKDGVCTITLSDGNSFKVQSGLVQHPVVTVMVENNRHYWAYYADGKVEPLLFNGEKVEVTTVVPAIRFNDEGRLEISVDGGRFWVESEGKVAAGLFSDVTQGDGYIVLTLSDGFTQYRVPMMDESEILFHVASGRMYFNAGESKTVAVEMVGVNKYTVTEKPEGWKVNLVSGQMTITAPASGAGETAGYIKILGVGEETVIAQAYVSVGKAPCLVSIASDLTVTIKPNPQSFFYGAEKLEDFDAAAIAARLSGVINPQMAREPFSASTVTVPLSNLVPEVTDGQTYVVWALPVTGYACTESDVIYESVSSIGIVNEVSSVTFEDARLSVSLKGADSYYLIPLENDMTLETCISDLNGNYADTYDRYKHTGTFRGRLSDVFETLIAGTEYTYLVLPVKLGSLRKDDAETFSVRLNDYVVGGALSMTLSQTSSDYKSLSVSYSADEGTYKYFLKIVGEEDYVSGGYSDDAALISYLSSFNPKAYSGAAVFSESNLNSGSKYYAVAVAVDRNGMLGVPQRLEVTTRQVLYSDKTIVADYTATMNSAVVTLTSDSEIVRYRYMFLAGDGANYWYYTYSENDQSAYEALIYGSAEYTEIEAGNPIQFPDLTFGEDYIFRVVGYDAEGKVTALAKVDITPTVGKVIQSSDDSWASLKPAVAAVIAGEDISLTVTLPEGCTEAVVVQMSSEEYQTCVSGIAARLKTDYVLQHSSAVKISESISAYKPGWTIGVDTYVLVAWAMGTQWFEPLVIDVATGQPVN